MTSDSTPPIRAARVYLRVSTDEQDLTRQEAIVTGARTAGYYAAVGIAAGHGKAFKRVAVGLGLVGPMRATTPGDAFLAAVAPILVAAGPLPHARLDTGGETTAPRKQATRMLKCECQACGYTVRTARKWLETAGAPLCPIEGHGPMQHDPLDPDNEADDS